MSLDKNLFTYLDLTVKKNLLRCAIEADCMPAVERVLKSCPDIDINEPIPNTSISPLELAMINNSNEMVSLIIKDPKIQKSVRLLDSLPFGDSPVRSSSMELTLSLGRSLPEEGSAEEKKSLLHSRSDEKLSHISHSKSYGSGLVYPMTPTKTLRGGLISVESIQNYVDVHGKPLNYLDIAMKNALSSRGNHNGRYDPKKVEIVKTLCDAGFISTNNQEQLREKLRTLGVPGADATATCCCSRVAEACVIL